VTQIRPTLFIIGGINGAGKSTMAERLRGLDDFAEAVMLNPDREAEHVDVFDNTSSGGPSSLIAQARRGAVTILDPHALPSVTEALAPLAARG